MGFVTNWREAFLGLKSVAAGQTVQLFSRAQLFAIPWTSAHRVSLSITSSWSLLKLMPIESVMPSNHLILCHPLFLLPSIFPSIRVFSNESVLSIRWPKYWSFSFSISPSNEYSGLKNRANGFNKHIQNLPSNNSTHILLKCTQNIS